MTGHLTNSWPARLSYLAAALVAFVFAALAVAAHAGANDHHKKVDGVRASLKHGTLSVKGSSHGDTVALRLKAGDPSRIQVDVGDDASADFSFARSDVSAINVKGGNRSDSIRVDDANGAFTDSIPTTIAGGNGNDTLQGGQTVAVAEN